MNSLMYFKLLRYLRNDLPKLASKATLMLVTLFALSNCSDDDPAPIPQPEPAATPVIQSISPTNGYIGDTIVISGTNFGSQPSANVVKFNITTAKITAATNTKLTAIVPLEATSGKVHVIVNQDTTTGPEFTVLSLHSINSFSPTTGGTGTEVVITGTNFGTEKSQVSLSLNSLSIPVLAVNNTQITASIPEGAATGKFTVTINGKLVESATTFSVITSNPVISNFYPASGVVGGQVIIAGSGFSLTPEDNLVKFNGVAAKVTSASATQLKVITNYGTTTGKIEITVAGKNGASSVDFEVLAPIITSFSPEQSGIGTTIQIYGSNFGDSLELVKIKFNGVDAEPHYLPSNNIVWVRVPVGATSGKVTVNVGGAEGTSSTDFTVLPGLWEKIAQLPQSPSRMDAIAFSYGSKVYAGLGQVETKDFWEYDPDTDIWTQKADFGGSARAYASAFTLSDKGYVVGGVNNESPYNELAEVWQYDTQTNVWVQKGDFPGGTRSHAVAFNIYSKGYFTTGRSGSTYKKDMWEYDPASDTWTEKASMPAAASVRMHASGFSVNGKGYMGTGYSGSAKLKDFWEFDPATNTWTQKTDFPGGARNLGIGFSTGSYGYMGLGITNVAQSDFYQYNPVTNSWTMKSNLPYGMQQVTSTSTPGGYGYIVGGNGSVNSTFKYIED